METRLDRYEGAREGKLEQLKELIASSNNIVFLGGAGVSTESGIPDFRSGDGIYNQDSGLKYRPIDVVSHSFFVEHTEEFYDFYKRKLCYPKAKPNKAHKALVRLEKMGKLKATVTQNIDDLHQMAGSLTTIELHGSVMRNYCMKCKKRYDLDYVLKADGVPYCSECGGLIRPDVVLYEEYLDPRNEEAAKTAIHRCDLMIIGGTSLTVYPAAKYVEYLTHNRVVIINKSSTYLDLQALLCIHDSIGDVLDAVVPKRRASKKATTEPATKSTTKKATTKKATAKKATAPKTKSTSTAKKSTTSKKPATTKKPASKTTATKKPSTSKTKSKEEN